MAGTAIINEDETGPPGELFGIRQVARDLGITERTLRFYEDRELVCPQRVGGMRVYSRREIARMKLIIRGKRMGFSIREIKEFLDLYEIDPSKRTQMERLSEQVRVHLIDLEEQHEALETTLAELRNVEAEIQKWRAQQ